MSTTSSDTPPPRQRLRFSDEKRLKMMGCKVGFVCILVCIGLLIDQTEASVDAISSFHRVKPLASSLFNWYTAVWEADHLQWKDLNPMNVDAMCLQKDRSSILDEKRPWLPVCIGGETPLPLSSAMVTGAGKKGDYYVGSATSCPKMICVPRSPFSDFTPADTLTFFPPTPSTGSSSSETTESSVLCPLESFPQDSFLNDFDWELGGGVPPEFAPISLVRMEVEFSLSSLLPGDDMLSRQFIQGAIVEVWQVDPTKWTPLTLRSDSSEQFSQVEPQQNMCHNKFVSDDTGIVRFTTWVPPPTGAPRLLSVRVTAPGFETLLTQVYLDKDWRLQQLTRTPLEGSGVNAFHRNENIRRTLMLGGLTAAPWSTPQPDHPFQWLEEEYVRQRDGTKPPPGGGIDLDGDGIDDWVDFLGVASRDPRVAKVDLVDVPLPDNLTPRSGFHYGHLAIRHPLRMLPLRRHAIYTPEGISHEMLEVPLDVAGVWVDHSGGLVEVESHGSFFFARELPLPRSWGTLTGVLLGNTIRGVQIPRTSSASVSAHSHAERFTPSQLLSNVAYGAFSGHGIFGSIITGDAFQNFPTDNTAMTPSMTIEWTEGNDGISSAVWTKQDYFRNGISVEGEMTSNLHNIKDSTARGYGYRYLKLEITRDAMQSSSGLGKSTGQLDITEIEFYEGLAFHRPVPAVKMTAPNTPTPLRVSCSSVENTNSHCYRAFDGRRKGTSWTTKSQGSYRNQLVKKEWILLDLGEGHLVRPSAMRIVCNVPQTVAGLTLENIQEENLTPSEFAAAKRLQLSRFSGCPRTFSLLGSRDGVGFERLYSEDLYDTELMKYAGEEGQLFTFLPYSRGGRMEGERCPSCEGVGVVGGHSGCQLDRYDPWCASLYCGVNGRCALPEKPCQAGEYLDREFAGWKKQAIQCKPCPAGRYGAPDADLSNFSCSGPCAEGFYCPVGSKSPQEFVCGDWTGVSEDSRLLLPLFHSSEGDITRGPLRGVFCPIGSSTPREITAGRRGYASVLTGETISGDEVLRLTEPLLDLSPINFYAIASSQVLKEREAVWKPESPATLDDYTRIEEQKVVDLEIAMRRKFFEPFFYTDTAACRLGHYCLEGVERPCPLGFYGETEGLATAECSGKCPQGTYCPEGSILPSICPLGHYCEKGDFAKPCPPGVYGASEGLSTSNCSGPCTAGHYCPVGSISETQVPCPAGRYGDGGSETELCSGECPAGYYCPIGTKHRFQFPCGSPSVYCPAGSVAPHTATPGYYTTNILTSSKEEDMPSHSRDAQTIAPMGWYAWYGHLLPCPPGTYGSSKGLSGNAEMDPSTWHEETADQHLPIEEEIPNDGLEYHLKYTHKVQLCSGFCPAGYYCLEHSDSPTKTPCPAGSYGKEEGLKDKNCSGECPLGHYCPKATVLPIACPAGTFGNTTGLRTPLCSGPCQAGFYCPEGSITADPIECGGTEWFCPTGSPLPTRVSPGYYTLLDTPELSLPSVSDLADPTFTTVPSSNTHIPTLSERLASSTTKRTRQAICPPGFFCKDGIRTPCPAGTFGNEEGLSSEQCSGKCIIGSYCPQGTKYIKGSLCPAGRYGSERGLRFSTCSGKCAPGFYCPAGSTNPEAIQCAVVNVKQVSLDDWRAAKNGSVGFLPAASLGSSYLFPDGAKTITQKWSDQRIATLLAIPSQVYCPEESSIPIVTMPGFYTTGGTRNTRFGITQCEAGSYCIKGEKKRCPAGRYGKKPGLWSDECNGLCERGYYCPAGSTSPQAKPCPAGRYGAVKGLATSLCSGACSNPMLCAEASVSSSGLRW